MNNDLALINSVAHKNYSAGEVYIFSVVLCDNDVDKDFEYFDSDALEKFAGMFVGVMGIYDSDPFKENQNPRIYRCRTEKLSTKQTAYGAEYVRLVADAYIPVSEANKNLIYAIDSGIKKEVSIGCGIGECSCSICGEDIRISKCKHKKGKIYNGKICCGVLKSPTDVYEWSFVFKKQDGIDKKAETVKKPKRANMSNDLISRQAVIDICYKGQNYDISTIKNIIKNIWKLPSTKPPEETNGDGETVLRWWETSNGETIREWAVDEYIRWNPEDKKILPYKIDGKTINVEAHCVEARRTFATKNGQRLVAFEGRIDYSKDNNEKC